MPERICHLLAPAPFGGLETVVATLAAAQAAEGAEVSVVGLFRSPPADQPFWTKIRASGVRAIPVSIPHRRYVRGVAQIGRALGDIGAEILHTHGYQADVLGLLAARRCRIPVVSTVHGFTGGDGLNRLYEWLQRRALRRFDAVVAVSQALRVELQAAGVPGSRLHLLRNAWQPSGAMLDKDSARARLRIARDDGPVVVWAGRMSAEKGPDVMLDAFLRAFSGADPTPERPSLCMIGDGLMRRDLEQGYAARAKAGASVPEVRFTGAVQEVGSLLRAFDLMVLSSRSEGTPMILLEAMAAGVPVVTTAVGGIPDVVTENEAWIVPAADPARLADTLVLALAQLDESARKARTARNRLESAFGIPPWVAGYREVYTRSLRVEG